MAASPPPSPPLDVEAARQARQLGLWQRLQLHSHQLLYQLAMRGNGEAFGAPFEVGVPSLTERAVRLLKQRGYFAFETCERLAGRQARNKFTRHGAARFRGAYRTALLPAVAASRVERLLAFLREQTVGRPRPR